MHIFIFAQLKRETRLRIAGFHLWLDKWQLWFDQKRCPHSFRPARIEAKVGRICKICDKAELLTPEEFFAYFGEQGSFTRKS
ncbi:MAG: hypothetical protein M3367_03195 [Acidobacteriota bacterium]|nr:hypothetical protein [Acidobacteriota bacterium]